MFVTGLLFVQLSMHYNSKRSMAIICMKLSVPGIDTPFLLPELAISPFSIDELFAQICTHYQQEIEANAIEIGEERKLSIG